MLLLFNYVHMLYKFYTLARQSTMLASLQMIC